MRPKRNSFIIPALAVLGFCASARAQDRQFLSHLSAGTADPIYTTYAAARERSSFALDQGYHLRFYDPAQPTALVTSQAGTWSLAFRQGAHWQTELTTQPLITTSYSDVVRYNFRPLPEVRVDVTFLVYSSRLAVQDITLQNTSSRELTIDVASNLNGATFTDIARAPDGSILFRHEAKPDGWTTEHAQPFVSKIQDVLVFSMAPDSVAGLHARKRFTLAPHGTARWRLIRGIAPVDSGAAELVASARKLLPRSLDPYVRADEQLYARIPVLGTTNRDQLLLYWDAFTLMRQVMMPPEGATRFPYYVFSREPQWGWGHGGQVFHESLTMLAYALMDPQGAMASQRVFSERQHPDGYIPYRVGPYLEETIAYEGQLTTSAPWYAWQNWEIYQITHDRAFLRDMYRSSSRFYNWYSAHRDRDGDGLFEWGAHAVLESVRDGDVAVWDQVAWPSNFEAVDLNTMMVSEADALAAMANQLGLHAEAARWRAQATALRNRIERTFWDDATGFYYHVDLKSHSFSFAKPNDLKRREIIGFLPLWAGVSSRVHADRLIRTLTNPAAFWRRNGIPSLAADDPYYNSKGYWNGPVWVEWNYLIERGLLRYGRADLARALTNRVADGMITQLKKNHVFWEMYGPDGDWAGHHQVYIWAGLIARMMLDAQ